MHLARTTLKKSDREKVSRAIAGTTTVLADAVARLYVNYPDSQKWNYTGLSGCLILGLDTIGNVYFLKLVDISTTNRGVLWDQEVYEGFQYSQDRTFFHSFEIENCSIGLCFPNEKEAERFRARVLKVAPLEQVPPRGRTLTRHPSRRTAFHTVKPTPYKDEILSGSAENTETGFSNIDLDIYGNTIGREEITKCAWKSVLMPTLTAAPISQKRPPTPPPPRNPSRIISKPKANHIPSPTYSKSLTQKEPLSNLLGSVQKRPPSRSRKIAPPAPLLPRSIHLTIEIESPSRELRAPIRPPPVPTSDEGVSNATFARSEPTFPNTGLMAAHDGSRPETTTSIVKEYAKIEKPLLGTALPPPPPPPPPPQPRAPAFSSPNPRQGFLALIRAGKSLAPVANDEKSDRSSPFIVGSIKRSNGGVLDSVGDLLAERRGKIRDSDESESESESDEDEDDWD